MINIKGWLKDKLNSILLDNISVQQLRDNDVSLSIYYVELSKRVVDLESKKVNGRLLKEL